MSTVRKVTPPDRVEGDPTPGMVREEAIVTDRLWAGLVQTAPQMASGWHHHGENESAIYVLSGVFRVEFGPGGEDVMEGHPGDFVLVPPGVIHRETNPSEEESRLIVVRAINGPPTINVDGPQPL